MVITEQKGITAAEMMRKSGINWDVIEQDVYRANENGAGDVRFIKSEGYKALVRGDNGDTLSIVRDSYGVVQPSYSFGFFDSVVGSGRAVYTGAGEFNGGRKIFVQAKAEGLLRVGKTDDVIEKHLLLADSFDGSTSYRMFFTPVRVVCANTFARALREGRGEGITIRHIGEMTHKIEAATAALGIAMKYYDDLGAVISRLAEVQIKSDTIKSYFAELVPDSADAESNSRTEKVRNRLEHLFVHGKGNQLPGVRGTVWAAFNAVTEYTTHEKSVRGAKTDAEKPNLRLKSLLFGSTGTLVEKAWTGALALAGAKE